MLMAFSQGKLIRFMQDTVVKTHTIPHYQQHPSNGPAVTRPKLQTAANGALPNGATTPTLNTVTLQTDGQR